MPLAALGLFETALAMILLFCSTPNEKLLGRLVKEKVRYWPGAMVELIGEVSIWKQSLSFCMNYNNEGESNQIQSQEETTLSL